ncbi:unnamed protein product, partial [Mesorhabditis spiculigera]
MAESTISVPGALAGRTLSAVYLAAAAAAAVCLGEYYSGESVSSASEDSRWDGVLALVTRFHPLMLPLPITLWIPPCIATPLAVAFMLFISGIYLIHCIALIYARYKLHKKINYSGREPGISIIKPLVGVDHHLAANLETFFNIDYHEFELLFCVHEKTDPAIPIVQRLMVKYPSVKARLFYGGEDVGHNPKINNMMPAYRASSYPLVLISDCGIRIQPDSLQDLASSMTEGVGLVTQTPYSVDRQGLGPALEKVYFGTGHARIYLAGNCLGFVCSTGMSCLLRKRALEECGGLQAFGRYLAEDYFFGTELVKRNWKTRIASLPAMQNAAEVTPQKFSARICRWMKLRVAMLPHTIILEPIQDCLLSGLLAALSASHLFGANPWLYFAIHMVFWFTMDYLLMVTLQNGPLPYRLLELMQIWLLREVSAFPTYLRALCQPDIEWRRGVYRLRWGGLIYRVKNGLTSLVECVVPLKYPPPTVHL